MLVATSQYFSVEVCPEPPHPASHVSAPPQNPIRIFLRIRISNPPHLNSKQYMSRQAFPVFMHNPVRKVWQAEDSRVYWFPDMKRYGRIKPKVSDFDWLNQTDYLQKM